tara:strand:+ start:1297 stop:2292 length:996 start_codon:yes stop_codon:yes gene_type:complete
MKIALLEVSHWHFPLYIKDLLELGVDVVGLSDKEEEIRLKYSKLFKCPAYESWDFLLKESLFDAAFAFGVHREMPRIGEALIAKGIPFSIEKPAGTRAIDVEKMAQLAGERNVQVSVPLVQRYGPLNSLLEYLSREEGAQFVTSSWRFNAGPPSRYTKILCDWMLDPGSAGGGCLINLAPHFIDLALRYMPNQPDIVFAQVDNSQHNELVEDTATLMMSSKKGGQATIQTGYNFPESSLKREYSFSLSSKGHYVQSRPDGVAIVRPNKPVEVIKMQLDSDPLYGRYVRKFVKDRRLKRPIETGLADLERAMRVIEAGYHSAKIGQAINISL